MQHLAGSVSALGSCVWSQGLGGVCGYKLQCPVQLGLCFMQLWTGFLMQERGHSGLPSDLLSHQRSWGRAQAGGELAGCAGGGSGCGGASILACPSLPGDLCRVGAVASLLCPEQAHAELQACQKLPERSSLFLWPLAIFLSPCRSVLSLLAEILSMSCLPEVQDWLSSSLRPVNHAEEPDSCWPWGTVPCSLPALQDGPAWGAPVSLAATGRALAALAWDSTTAELGLRAFLICRKSSQQQLCQELGWWPN